MLSLELPQIVLVVCLSVFTAVAAVTDLRSRRIPNRLTLPAFGLGIVYQITFHPGGDTVLGSLADAAAGFGIGFGTLFVLWLIGGGGGGDAKLMGALSIWLGWRMTIAVLVLSTVFVIVGTIAMIFWSVIGKRFGITRAKFSAAAASSKRGTGTIADRQQRRIMTYAFPVALATWAVLAWFHLRPH